MFCSKSCGSMSIFSNVLLSKLRLSSWTCTRNSTSYIQRNYLLGMQLCLPLNMSISSSRIRFGNCNHISGYLMYQNVSSFSKESYCASAKDQRNIVKTQNLHFSCKQKERVEIGLMHFSSCKSLSQISSLRNIYQIRRFISTKSQSHDSHKGDKTSHNLKNENDTESEFDNEDKELNTVRDILSNLSADQKREILEDLQFEEAVERRRLAEEKLASWHWRSKFGRPTKFQPSKVDASGTYCEIPHDWLMKKVAESAMLTPPTLFELRKVAVFNALPFVGFGFLDNVIMIVAGDYIDLTIGIYLGISTMAAAALGNTISDLAGIGSAWYVESLASKIGVHHPQLTKEQEEMPSTRWSANIGRGVGVVVGCFLGMFPLLFLPAPTRKKVEVGETDEEKKRERETNKETKGDKN